MVLPGTKSDFAGNLKFSLERLFSNSNTRVSSSSDFSNHPNISKTKIAHIQLLSFISVHNRTDKRNCTIFHFRTGSFLLLGYQGLYVDCHFDSEPLRTIQTKVGVPFLTWTNLNFYLLSGTFVSFLCVCLASLFNCAKFTFKTPVWKIS